MIVAEREGIEVDWCPSCPGLWFDAGELDLLAEKNRLPPAEREGSGLVPAETAERGLPCPRCDRKMKKVWFDPARTVLVDRCSHGLWFDRGEVGRALDAIRPEPAGLPGTIVSFLGETYRR